MADLLMKGKGNNNPASLGRGRTRFRRGELRSVREGRR
jgi:hypothetical protein